MSPPEPLLERVGLKKIVETPVSFSAGADRVPLALPKGVKALPLICYEVICPNETLDSGDGAGLIVNLTNDAWFGDTPGPYQHFRQAQVRAVEAGLPLLRSANNGISGVIRADGTVMDAIGLDVVDVVDVQLPVAPARQAKIATGYAGGVICAFLAIIACGMLFRRRKEPN